jgi:HD-like signal output (HDOD) protein
MSQAAVEQSQSAGMLAHIGSLILAGTFGGKIPQIQAEIDSKHVSVVLAERTYVGVSHAELGAALLDLWGFPGDVVEAVLFHHDPSLSGATKGMSPMTAVHAAQALVKPTGIGLDREYLERIGCASHVETWAEIAHSTLAELDSALKNTR